MADAASSLLLAFALTSLIVEITPGPNMAYLATLSLTQGARIGLIAIAGIAIGLAIYGVAVAFGLGMLIERFPWLYESLRWSGVAYLLWLAWEAWTQEKSGSPIASHQVSAWSAFRRGLVTNLLNPKAAIFYIAVVPEFIQLGAQSAVAQTLVLSAIYVAIATLVHTTIVILASQSQRLIQTPEKRRTIRRASAILLAGIAVWFAWWTARS